MDSLISIILPTYNSIEFLQERIDTIVQQTMNSWECIVIDGFSTDGTWGKLQSTADTDKRFKLFQYPANGPYDAWNKGIEKATGKYIYIATADDTMQLNLLEVLSKELDEHEDCGLAHCKLTIIDEASKPSTTQNWNNYYACQYYGELMNQKHIRIAPLDGILHCGLKTVYTSITQLLIRKEVFNKLGLFLTNGGSIADFEWGMRVSLLYNTLHIPEYLATWRVHGKQLTSIDTKTNPLIYKKFQKFIEIAFSTSIQYGLNKKYYRRSLKDFYLMQEFLHTRRTFVNSSSFKNTIKLFLKFPYLYITRQNKEHCLKVNPIIWTRKIIMEMGLNKQIING